MVCISYRPESDQVYTCSSSVWFYCDGPRGVIPGAQHAACFVACLGGAPKHLTAQMFLGLTARKASYLPDIPEPTLKGYFHANIT